MAERLQRKRTKGSRLPPGTICVNRGTAWGNPFRVGYWCKLTINGPVMEWMSGAIPAPGYTLVETPEMAVAWFRRYAEQRLRYEPDWLEPLREHDIACFCPVGSACHGDVLLELLYGPHSGEQA